MKTIANQVYDEERALYGVSNVHILDCTFDGPADGESAVKECSDIVAERCSFNLRYPFWHVHGLDIRECYMSEDAARLSGIGSCQCYREQAARRQGLSGVPRCACPQLRYQIG